MAHDSDPFNRWEAGQNFAKDVLLGLVRRVLEGQRSRWTLPGTRVSRILSDPSLDGSIKALTLSLPSEELLSQELSQVDPDAVHRARSSSSESSASRFATIG